MIYSVVRTVNLFRDCCCFLVDSETFDLFSYLSFVGSILFSFGVGAGGCGEVLESRNFYVLLRSAGLPFSFLHSWTSSTFYDRRGLNCFLDCVI